MVKGGKGKTVLPDGTDLSGGVARMGPDGRLRLAPGKGGLKMPEPEDDRFMQRVPKRGPAMTPSPDIVPPSCEACGNFAARLLCGRCKVALFCDEICQRRIWPTHKHTCEPPDEILRKITDNPNALEEKEVEIQAEAREMAESMKDFLAIGGRKRQASLSSLGSTARSSSFSSDGRTLSVDSRARSSSPATESNSASLSVDDKDPGIIDEQEVDDKRPAWLRRQIDQNKQAGSKTDDTSRRLSPLARAVESAAEDSKQKTEQKNSMDEQTKALVHWLEGLGPVKEDEVQPPIMHNPTFGAKATQVDLMSQQEMLLKRVDPEEPRPQVQPGEPPGGVVTLRNGVQMPRIVLGTAGHKGLAGADGRAAICAALKLGYRALDTSEMNRNLLDVAWAHRKAGIPRKELFIIAKIAPWNYGYQRTRSAFFRQLDELRLDYVDLLLLQWPHCWAPSQTEWGITQWRRSIRWNQVQRQGSWRAIEEIYNEGKARCIGISNFTIDHFDALLRYCREKPHVMQCESHPHWTNKHIRNWCREKEVAFQGYAPFGGQLSERGNVGKRAIDCPAVNWVADQNQVSPAQVCMYWNLARNASVVVKSKTFQRLRENLHVTQDVRLPGSNLKIIDQIAQYYKEFGPCYWGHNDVDRMHPWLAEEEMMQEMMAAEHGPVTMSGPKVKTASQIRASSWTPQPPAGATAPGEEEEVQARGERAGSVPPGKGLGKGAGKGFDASEAAWQEHMASLKGGGKGNAGGKGGPSSWIRSSSRQKKGPPTIPEE